MAVQAVVRADDHSCWIFGNADDRFANAAALARAVLRAWQKVVSQAVELEPARPVTALETAGWMSSRRCGPAG
ncbi:hypothetical protein ACQP00_20880 [Dactylosporangium sp. CS-047395]|uniref:hypothetical protein n=1 Tax=Dactylosporangium sp. CS-047395 TaxID=3239936 RepID=UPI003D8CE62F